MAKEMQQGEKLEGDDDDEGEGEDLAASVARWMREQDWATWGVCQIVCHGTECCMC